MNQSVRSLNTQRSRQIKCEAQNKQIDRKPCSDFILIFFFRVAFVSIVGRAAHCVRTVRTQYQLKCIQFD